MFLKTPQGESNQEIQPVHPKRNQSWILIGMTDAEAETSILWPPDAKNWLIRKDPDARKDRRWEEKGMTEDEMVGWHHWCNGHELGKTLGYGEGQGSLVCCSPQSHKEWDMTWQLNKNNNYRMWRGIGMKVQVSRQRLWKILVLLLSNSQTQRKPEEKDILKLKSSWNCEMMY